VISRTGGGAARPGASVARLLAVAAMPAGLAGAFMLAGPAFASGPIRIGWPFACKVDQGRLRLEPSAEQVYQVVGTPERRTFQMCRDRQNCRALTVYRFAVVCGEQRVDWADLVATMAEKGHAKFAVAEGRLAVVSPPPSRVRTEPVPALPSDNLLGAWCSNQFGAASQPFLRQACQEARRVLSNLGGPPADPPQRAAALALPQFFALPKGFAPLHSAGARLMRALPGSSSAASARLSAEPAAVPAGSDSALAVPKPTAQEPNERSADQAARAQAQPSSAGVAKWITNVHLASATVAASSEMAAESERAAARARLFNAMIALAGLLTATLAIVSRRRREQLKASRLKSDATLPGTTAVACLVTPRSTSRDRVLAFLNHSFVCRISAWRSHAQAVLAWHRHRVGTARRPMPAMTPAARAALDALPADARLLIAAREQLADRLGHLRQTIAPLARTAPALHVALARDLMAGERRLAKITIASLAVQPDPAPSAAASAADPAAERSRSARKLGQNRLQRVTVDLDRLQAIIAGAISSLSRNGASRALPRDTAEAYLALGVNAGVGLSTLKKLVDALRVSWHPDLATSDDDRRHRDERIKEINVAWDLIVGKRGAD
jgi:hypothetical protein